MIAEKYEKVYWMARGSVMSSTAHSIAENLTNVESNRKELRLPRPVGFTKDYQHNNDYTRDISIALF